MQIFPAIDLRGGQVVRLYQGDYDQMTVYGADPCAVARKFLAAGARYLHVVDLDGARSGTAEILRALPPWPAREDFLSRLAVASAPSSASSSTWSWA